SRVRPAIPSHGRGAQAYRRPHPCGLRHCRFREGEPPLMLLSCRIHPDYDDLPHGFTPFAHCSVRPFQPVLELDETHHVFSPIALATARDAVLRDVAE